MELMELVPVAAVTGCYVSGVLLGWLLARAPRGGDL